MLSRLSLAALIAALPARPVLADPATLDIAAPFEIKAADPLLSGDIFLKLDVMETLVNSDATGALLPGLSETWSVSEDKLRWRFHIRPGGGSMTAARSPPRPPRWR